MDVSITNHGSLYLVTPLTETAEEWLAENVGGEVSMFGSAIAVEPRYVAALIDGMGNDGLVVG